jgi:DNA mismatch repair protein MutL
VKDVIHLLPDALANQIAAGEVVQRPSSAVKELLENAVDAKATQIKLILKDAGKSLIQVIDNGFGMSETDARMCFERHATSKIATTNDLFAIRTFGFRGEAMASIAAVAQVEMRTKRKDAEVGTFIQIEGSQLKKQEPVATPNGTSVSIKNLFFNVPARRNFLKSDKAELNHAIDEFLHVALSYPEISFSMYHNDNELYDLPMTDRIAKRITSVFGKQYQQNLLPIEEEIQHIKIKGYVGNPELAKKTRGEQFFFLNRRFIKSLHLNHAVTTAYENLLPKDSFPFYYINITIDPAHVDINVHPTKTEVKFDDERAVYAVILATVKRALTTGGIGTGLRFDIDTNYSVEGKVFPLDEHEKVVTIPSQLPFDPFAQQELQRQEKNLQNWQTLFGKTTSANISPSRGVSQRISPQEWTDFLSSNLPDTQETPSEPALILPSKLTDSTEKRAFQFHLRYIFYQVRTGVMVIDQFAAKERILYDRFIVSIQRQTRASQKVLFPKTLSFSSPDFVLIEEIIPTLNELGFQLEIFGKNTLIIQGVPVDMPDIDEKEAIESLVEQLKNQKTNVQLNKQERLAVFFAKKVAFQTAKLLVQEEIYSLIDQLMASSNPQYTPSGQPITHTLGLDMLEKMFDR